MSRAVNISDGANIHCFYISFFRQMVDLAEESKYAYNFVSLIIQNI